MQNIGNVVWAEARCSRILFIVFYALDCVKECFRIIIVQSLFSQNHAIIILRVIAFWHFLYWRSLLFTTWSNMYGVFIILDLYSRLTTVSQCCSSSLTTPSEGNWIQKGAPARHPSPYRDSGQGGRASRYPNI